MVKVHELSTGRR